MKNKIQRLLYSILLYVYRFVGNLVRLVQPKQEVKTVIVNWQQAVASANVSQTPDVSKQKRRRSKKQTIV